MAHLLAAERMRGSAMDVCHTESGLGVGLRKCFGFSLTIGVWRWRGNQHRLAVVLQQFDIAHSLLGTDIFDVVLRGRVFDMDRVGRLGVVGVHGD